jgi:uncharacterized protein (DUF1778 family)
MPRGRPRKLATERLSESLRVGVTADQWTVIATAANMAGLTISDFARIALEEKLERDENGKV